MKDIVDKTVTASQLSAEEQDELRRELVSHVHEQTRELELQGYSEEQIVQYITDAFGDTQQIGKQLFLVHRRFERIPWIGPLFYYQPLIYAVGLFLSTVLLIVLEYTIGMILSEFNEVLPLPFLHISLFLFVAFSLAQGVWARAKLHRIGAVIEAILLSHIPFLFYVSLLALSIYLRQAPYPDWLQYNGIGMMVLTHIGWIMGGACLIPLYEYLKKRTYL